MDFPELLEDATMQRQDPRQAERIAQQSEIIEQQLRTITALNEALGGEGSLTTDNLVRVGRLETEIDELRTKNAQLELALKQKDELLNKAKISLQEGFETDGFLEAEHSIQDKKIVDEINKSLTVQPSQEALEVVHMIEIQKNIYEIVDAKNVDEIRQHIEVETLYRLKDK